MSCHVCRCVDNGFCRCSCHGPLEAKAPDMQSIMAGDGHPDEGPCVVCGHVFDAHLDGCIFARPVEAKAEAGEPPQELRDVAVARNKLLRHIGLHADINDAAYMLTDAITAMAAKHNAILTRPAPAANTEGLRVLKRLAVNYSLRMLEKDHEIETCNCDACTDIRKARELTAALRGEEKATEAPQGEARA